MREWVTRPLSVLADIRVSNVDKKSLLGEKPVLLCNYMDVYGNDYIRSDIAFMEATASEAEIVRFKVDAGDVMITKDSETPDDIGIPAVVMDKIDHLVCGYHLALLKPRQEFVDPVFLCKQLASQEATRYFGQRATGSTRYGLSNRTLTNFLVALPEIAQQKKIADILRSIDTAIEQTEALIAKYQQIKAGLMHDLFTHGVLPNGQLRPPREQAPELYHETEVGWVSKDWQPVSLRDLVGSGNIVNGPFGSDLLTSELKTEGVPVLYVQDIKPGLFSRISRAHVTDQKANELAFCNVRQGDVLVAKVGDPPCDTCVYEQDQRAVVTQDVIRIRPTTNVDSLYLASMLNSPFGRKAVKRISIEGTRERVSLTEFKGLTFPIAPTAEQVLIAQRMSAVHSTIASETTKLGKLTRQKRGLMHDLLTGAVPVNVEAPEAVDG